MDLGLQIIKTKANLWTVQQRIKTTRLHILKTKPESTDYIKGAEQSEIEILEAHKVFTDLTDHVIALSRENAELARRNIILMDQIADLKNEIKYKDATL